MNVLDMERRCAELKEKFNLGLITDEEFRAEINKLRFQDSLNRWWMLGAQSGKWFMFDGTRWLPGVPPQAPIVPPPPLPMQTASVVSASSLTSKPPESVTMVINKRELMREYVTQPGYTANEGNGNGHGNGNGNGNGHGNGNGNGNGYPTYSAPVTRTPEYASPAPAVSAPLQLQPTRPLYDYDPTPAYQPKPQPPQVASRIRTPARAQTSPKIGAPAVIGCGAIAFVGLIAGLWFASSTFFPDNPVASFAGRSLSSIGMGAKPTSTQAIANVPSNIVTMLTTADQLVSQSQIDTAIPQYQKASQAASNSAVPLTRWSRALAFRGQNQDSLTKARQAVRIATNDVEANVQLCRSLTWGGQINDAIAVCENAVNLDAKNANAHAFLSEAYLHARKFSDALAQAQEAMKLEPQNAETHRAVAWALTMQGQKEPALSEWKKTLVLEPNFYFRHYELAQVYRLYFNMPNEAITEYQKANTLYNSHIPTITNLGIALLETNQPLAAIVQLRRASTLDPNNADTEAYLALAYQKSGQCTQAIPYFQVALKIDANNSLAQKGLGDCKSNQATSAPDHPSLTTPLVPPTLVPGK